MEQNGQTGVANDDGFDWVNWRPIKDKKPITGLGDALAVVIHSVTGLKPCDACKKRRERLNRLFPFKG